METPEELKQRRYQANLQSMLSNVDWAYSNVLKGSPISRNTVLQNMGLSSVQNLDSAEVEDIISKTMSAYNAKYGMAGTPERPFGGQYDYGGAEGLNAALAAQGLPALSKEPVTGSLAVLTGNQGNQVGAATIDKNFYRYSDSPTVYNTKTGKSYATPEDFFAEGGAKDWSNVEVVTPGIKVIAGNLPKLADTTTITADNLNSNQQGIKLPTVDYSGDTDSVVAGAKSYAEYVKEFLAADVQTDAEKKEQSILDQMASLTGEYAGKSAEQLTKEQEAGIPDIKKQVSDLNSQINTKLAEYEAYRLAQEGKPQTMATITGNVAQKKNQIASEVLILQARQQALQGQLDTAQSTVNRAIDLKYETIEFSLNAYQAQLNALEPTLNKEEKTIALAQQAYLDDKKQAIADAKALETNISNVLLTAISNGAPTSVQSAIQKATSYNAAIQAAGSYLQEQKSTGTTGTSGTSGIDYDTAFKNLRAQGISTSVLNKDGSLSQMYRKNIDLDSDEIDWLWEQITNGASFEEIRQAIRDGNGNPVILDTLVQELQ